MNKYILPNWPAPSTIRAATTTRILGAELKENQTELKTDLQLTQSVQWLNQVHGNRVIDWALQQSDLAADACFSSKPGQVCAVMTADCLPLLICDVSATVVAAIHAGWRGLLAGVITQTIQALKVEPAKLMVWLGPAIGPDHFEVGEEVRQSYIDRDPSYAAGFQFISGTKWLGDLYHLAKLNLAQLGVNQIYGGGYCTFCEEQLFFSYRREKGTTGRMANLIWLEENYRMNPFVALQDK